MQIDFHYYATYCAAILAGYPHEESEQICYAAQFVDCCSKLFLKGAGAPLDAATTQIASELVNSPNTTSGIQDVTRIWSSFHFIPQDLYAELPKRTKVYMNKYRLICGPNGELIKDTVNLAKNAGTLEAAGIAMHIVADSWAHRYFAGTPARVINDTNDWFYEIREMDGKDVDKKVYFRIDLKNPDDIDNSAYIHSLSQADENAIMNLGHGRAGHLPDYSFIRYKYMPAWKEYDIVVKDNPNEYYNAFCQMVYAMKYLRGANKEFQTGIYDEHSLGAWKDEIKTILRKRQLNSCADWKALGEKISGAGAGEFTTDLYKDSYVKASNVEKDYTPFGKFIRAAQAQKSMVTNRIYRSGNRLAGVSVEKR